MYDILKKYKHQKNISNLLIIFVSLIIAFLVNFFLLDSTDLWKNLKSSLLNSNEIELKSDIYLTKNSDKIEINAWKNINNCKTLSLSLVYNPENIVIENISSIIDADITKIWNIAWFESIIINFKNNKNINKNEKILELKIKKLEEKTENLNTINANFKDINWEIYLLTTSWLTF